MKRQTKCRGEYLERCRGLGEDVSAVLFGFGGDLGLARCKELSVSTEWYSVAQTPYDTWEQKMRRAAEEVNRRS